MAKASLVFNPIFRYLLRTLAYTTFLRGDSSQVVRETELWLVWSMVTPPNDNSESHYPDLAKIMMKGLAEIGGSEDGVISAGGLITLIAEYLNNRSIGNVVYDNLNEVEGEHNLNFKALQKMSIIKKVDDRFYYCHADIPSRSFLLPDPARTSVENRRNWRPSGYGTQDEQQEMEAEVPQAFPSQAGPSSSAPPPQQTTQDERISLSSIAAAIADLQQQQAAGFQHLTSTVTTFQERQNEMYEWFVQQGHFPPHQP